MSITLDSIREKLSKSSGFYSGLVQRKIRDLDIYSSNYWNPELINEVDRNGRICRSFNMYSKFQNAIVSPFSKSPWHAEIEDPNGIFKEVQDKIDDLENSTNTKYVFTEAVRSACITGIGFVILSTVDGKVSLEAISDPTHVALDPCCRETNASDCEYAAIVDYISNSKARRLYGDDVVNYDGSSILSGLGSQWTIPNDSTPLVTYYQMNEKGTVNVYKACGNKFIQDEIELPISRIPIFRFCYNEIRRDNKVDYNGIVDMTADLQFGINLAYSTLLERANRTPKANFLMPAKALDGLEEYYRKLQTKESLVCLYNGDIAPTPIVETYQTQDLMATIDTCNSLMASTLGIPSEGIQPMSVNQTATEILTQQANSESNVNALYENAYSAVYSFTTTLCELYCWELNIDQKPTFKLVNGPEVITKLQKRRQQLLAVANLVDDRSKKIIAKHYIDTLDADVKDPIIADIVANSEDVMFVSDTDGKQDPEAVSVLNRMNAVLDATQDELQKQIAVNEQLKQQLDELNLQLLNQKEQILSDMIKHNDQMRIEEAKLQLDAAEKQVELDSKQSTANVAMTKEMISLEKEKLKLATEEQKAMNSAMQEVNDVNYIQ